jgi:uncharacterized protein (DUF849 family)
VIQCALNGDYTRADHPEVPVTLEELVADAVECHAAGAASVHLHPRRPSDGVPTLDAPVHDAVVAAIRRASPGLEVSCSTHTGLDLGGAADRSEAVRRWSSPPDLVSLNLVEHGSIELGGVLLERGVGIEAGVFTLADADALLAAPWAELVTRVLVETIEEQEPDAAVDLARSIDARVAPLGRPRLWHGEGRASWAVIDAGLDAGVDIRVGLEDAIVGRHGGPAPGNAAQVAEMAERTSAG